MKSPFKFLLIVPTLFITACGYGLKEIYNGVPYTSGDFFKNYYTEWKDSINPYKSNNKITSSIEERELDEQEDKQTNKKLHNITFFIQNSLNTKRI